MDGWILILCCLLVRELRTNLFYCPMSLFYKNGLKCLIFRRVVTIKRTDANAENNRIGYHMHCRGELISSRNYSLSGRVRQELVCWPSPVAILYPPTPLCFLLIFTIVEKF